MNMAARPQVTGPMHSTSLRIEAILPKQASALHVECPSACKCFLINSTRANTDLVFVVKRAVRKLTQIQRDGSRLRVINLSEPNQPLLTEHRSGWLGRIETKQSTNKG